MGEPCVVGVVVGHGLRQASLRRPAGRPSALIAPMISDNMCGDAAQLSGLVGGGPGGGSRSVQTRRLACRLAPRAPRTARRPRSATYSTSALGDGGEDGVGDRLGVVAAATQGERLDHAWPGAPLALASCRGRATRPARAGRPRCWVRRRSVSMGGPFQPGDRFEIAGQRTTGELFGDLLGGRPARRGPGRRRGGDRDARRAACDRTTASRIRSWRNVSRSPSPTTRPASEARGARRRRR